MKVFLSLLPQYLSFVKALASKSR